MSDFEEVLRKVPAAQDVTDDHIRRVQFRYSNNVSWFLSQLEEEGPNYLTGMDIPVSVVQTAPSCEPLKRKLADALDEQGWEICKKRRQGRLMVRVKQDVLKSTVNFEPQPFKVATVDSSSSDEEDSDEESE